MGSALASLAKIVGRVGVDQAENRLLLQCCSALELAVYGVRRRYGEAWSTKPRPRGVSHIEQQR
jgi:hypothetical protein